MKDLETLSREDRDVTQSEFSSASETTRFIQESEPNSRYEAADSFGREAYRLSPLSEW